MQEKKKNIMQKKIKLYLKYNKNITTYFKFFASQQYRGCFWHTNNGNNNDFELSRIDDWIPIDCNWDDIRKQENEKTKT